MSIYYRFRYTTLAWFHKPTFHSKIATSGVAEFIRLESISRKNLKGCEATVYRQKAGV